MEVKKLKECCTIIAGQSPESKYYNSNGDGLPFFQGKADFGELYPSIRVYCSQPTKIAEKDDILLSVRAPVGPTNLAPCKVCIGRGLTAIRPSEVLLTRYVLLFFRYFEAQLASKGTGTTFKAITQDVVKNLEIPIPPLPEQERIVARIEELFSQLDAGVETLKKTKAQLAVYRQAVLKEAFNSAEVDCKMLLIAEILTKTRKGMSTGPFGTMIKKSDHKATGVPMLGIENIGRGQFVDGNKIYVTAEKAEELKAFSLRAGDIIISRSGTVGEICAVPERAEGSLLSTNLMRVSLDNTMIRSDYFIALFQSKGIVLDQIKELCKGSTRDFLNQTILKQIVFPVPSMEKQEEIVSIIEARMSVCDSIEQTVDAALQQAEAMWQSILKEAFEGRL